MPKKKTEARPPKSGTELELSEFRTWKGAPIPQDNRGVPFCPQCMMSDCVAFNVPAERGDPWCGRCVGYIQTFDLPAGRYFPEIL